MLATSISSYVSTASDATWATINANMISAFNARYNSGRVQGRSDVTSSPNSYSLYTSAQYSTYGTTCYNNGVSAADNRANASSVNYQTGYNAGYAAGGSGRYKVVTGTLTISGTNGYHHGSMDTGLTTVYGFIGGSIILDGGKLTHAYLDSTSGGIVNYSVKDNYAGITHTFSWIAYGL